ncbi:hypothetical protein AMS68_002131 [Peltaster fructicola]|uniref:Heterokaryon incompatibility domain-containing protein n=1 Tax=Peltaster fructicola TaxID=286661 RepID=A0A6H0XPG0_9PEZI|nr:hypothetical protein AMS68_002131 [Peltaster fructicola]
MQSSDAAAASTRYPANIALYNIRRSHDGCSAFIPKLTLEHNAFLPLDTVNKPLPNNRRSDRRENSSSYGSQDQLKATPTVQKINGKRLYQYSPLQPASIRILTLEPGTADELLHGSLAAHQLTTTQYSAISYAWGGPQRSQAIAIGHDSILDITTSAYKALLRFRHPTRAVQLWIDSICINQTDLEEKSAQVAVMGEVYKRASKVLVWLGEASETDALALWAVARLAQAWSDYEAMKKRGHGDQNTQASIARQALGTFFYNGRCPCCQEPCHWKQKTLEKSSNHTDLYLEVDQSLQVLFSKTYFTRLWPVQEVCLAARCTFYTGPHHVEFQTVYDALTMFTTLQLRMFTHRRLFRLMHQYISSRRQSPLEAPRTRLLDVLAATHHLQVGEPRDRIYAVYALVNPTTLATMRPNYETPMHQFWTEVSVHLLESPPTTSSHASVVLAMAVVQRFPQTFSYDSTTDQSDDDQVNDIKSGTKHLPSWVPDLSSHAEHMWAQLPSYQSRCDCFSAAGRGHLDLGPREEVGILSIKGHLLTRVVEIYHQPRHLAGLEADPIRWRNKKIRKLKHEDLQPDVREGTDASSYALQRPNAFNNHQRDVKGQLRRNIKFEEFYGCLTFARSSGAFAGLDGADESKQRSCARDMIAFLQQANNIKPSRSNAGDPALRQDFEDRFLRHTAPRTIYDVSSTATQSREHDDVQHRWTSYVPDPGRTHDVTVLQRSIAAEIFNECFTESWTHARRLAMFSDGKMGWVGGACNAGDSIMLLDGAPVPFAFAERLDGTFINHGDVYVQGFMHGEGWDPHMAKWLKIR